MSAPDPNATPTTPPTPPAPTPAPAPAPAPTPPPKPEHWRGEESTWREAWKARERARKNAAELQALRAAMEEQKAAQKADAEAIKTDTADLLLRFKAQQDRANAAERTAHLATSGVTDSAAQARLLREYDLVPTPEGGEKPGFDAWLADAQTNDPMIAAYFKSLSGAADDNPDVPPVVPPKPAVRPNAGKANPPPPTGTRYTDAAVSAMTPEQRRTAGGEIAKQMLAAGEVKMSPALRKRMGLPES